MHKNFVICDIVCLCGTTRRRESARESINIPSTIPFRCRRQYFSRFENARSGRQLLSDTLYDIGAHGATPEALPLCSGTREAQVDAAANDRPLELGECAGYLVEQASCRRRGVDVLLIQIDPNRL